MTSERTGPEKVSGDDQRCGYSGLDVLGVSGVLGKAPQGAEVPGSLWSHSCAPHPDGFPIPDSGSLDSVQLVSTAPGSVGSPPGLEPAALGSPWGPACPPFPVTEPQAQGPRPLAPLLPGLLGKVW